MTSIAMIDAAALRMAGYVRRTPLLNSPLLDRIAGRRVFVKAECLQWTGSFKFRGGWAAVSALSPDLRALGVIAYSSGNHAQGVALAAAMHDVPAVIVMPADAPSVKIQNTKAYGAEVVLYDRDRDDRDVLGAAIATARGLTIGAGLLVASLAFRTLDAPLCDRLPHGTHFLWHMLNAVMLGWMIEVYCRHRRAATDLQTPGCAAKRGETTIGATPCPLISTPRARWLRGCVPARFRSTARRIFRRRSAATR